MHTRTLKVEFTPEYRDTGIAADVEIHDISISDRFEGVPRILENPHIDFPGVWQHVGEGPDGAHRYAKIERVADTNDTVEGG
jgi:hypothetical protein